MTIAVTVEDGTGLEAANAYDTTADAVTWLVDRGYHSLEASSEQARHLVEATRAVEGVIAHHVTGWARNEDQGLLYPRAETFDRRGRELDGDERPMGLRHGIFLIAEEMARLAERNERLRLIDDFGHLEGVGKTRYRSPRSFGDLHPQAWALIKESLPSTGLRFERRIAVTA